VRHLHASKSANRLCWTALGQFFRTAFRTKVYGSVGELQADLDGWLVHYNRERPHQGYRNLGRRPIDTIEEYLARQSTVIGEA